MFATTSQDPERTRRLPSRAAVTTPPPTAATIEGECDPASTSDHYTHRYTSLYKLSEPSKYSGEDDSPVTPPFASPRRRRNKGKKAECSIKWE
ncbi:hypothetical protein JCM1840_006044 [Sporobolomyces johnsonii]